MRAVWLIGFLVLSSCATSQSPRDRQGLFDLGSSGGFADRATYSGAGVGSGQSRANPNCLPLSDDDRAALLSLANPTNFPKTKYRRGGGFNLDRVTDCSHFVHEIYRRAGLRYGFRDTSQLKATPEFELLPEEEAMPGDMMLFRGHVGLVDDDGNIISATYTHGRKRRGRSSITRLRRTAFKPLRGRLSVLRYRCRPPESFLQVADYLKPKVDRAPTSK